MALTEALGGQLHTVAVTGPLGEHIEARFGLANNNETAVIEVAEASGLHCVPAGGARDALRSTSRGTGELILAALKHRPKTLIMGLGGSATTDGGAGMLQALGGARLLDNQGEEIGPGGAGLARLATADLEPAIRRFNGIQLIVACDVTNPLLGPEGAAAVFGPQKGANENDVRQLDANLVHFSRLVKAQGLDIASFPGSGAAGGGIGGTVKGILGADSNRE